MQKYIGSDVTSMVTLPVLIFEPMTMLQKMAEVRAILPIESVGNGFVIYILVFFILVLCICLVQLMEYSHLLDKADECEDPYMRMVYAGKCTTTSIS